MKAIIILFIFQLSLITPLLYSQTISTITYDAGTDVSVTGSADICATDIIINGTFSGGGTICGGALPVTMISFNAGAVNRNDAKLEWTTGVELNNSGFDIERKTIKEGDAWRKIAFVNGNGTTTEPKSYSFEDKKLQTNTYKYRLKQIDFNGNFEYFEPASDVIIGAPKNFSVSQNYPNPSNPKSKIEYQIPADNKVTIKMYDVIGREIAVLVNEVKKAGYYTVEFDGTGLATGVYFYVINTAEFKDVKKLILVK